MKRLLTTVALAAMLSTSASAMSEGMLVDVSLGLSTPVIGPAVKMGTNASDAVDIAKTLGFGPAIQGDVWAEFTHFIPIIPNVRYESATLAYAGTQSLTIPLPTGNLVLTGETFFNMNNQDVILFWGVPFATLIPFVDKVDFGLGVKLFNGGVGASSSFASSATKLAFPLPYAWLRGAVSIPVVNVGLAFDTKFIGTDAVPAALLAVAGGISANFNETVVKATWGLSLPIPVITMEAGVELGWKTTSLVANVPNTVYFDGSFNGAIFGIYGVFGI